MKHKIMYIVAGIIIATAIALIGIVTFWSVYPYKPLEINKVSIKTEEAKRGEIFIYELDYCKKGSDQVHISRKFIDGVVYSVPEVYTTNQKGCRVSNIGILIPESLPSGEYRLELDYTYKVNPIRTITVSTITGVFLIK